MFIFTFARRSYKQDRAEVNFGCRNEVWSVNNPDTVANPGASRARKGDR